MAAVAPHHPKILLRLPFRGVDCRCCFRPVPCAARSPLSPPSTLRATIIGIAAPALWATLPLLATLVAALPPLQTVASAFTLGAVLLAAAALARGSGVKALLTRSPAAWAIGVGGLFGWHFCYFLAVQRAPVAEASLINQLWPLLMVLASAALPGDRLRPHHIAGAALGLTGAALLITGGGRVALQAHYASGYALAAACAVIWAGYSLLNRRFARAVPSSAVAGFCAATAALAWCGHAIWETTANPSWLAWAGLAGLGLGPVGLAFIAWDHGTKHGDIRILGAGSYLQPLAATALLVLFGRAPASWMLLAACVCIACGAALAARELLLRTAPAGGGRHA
jgi:drug/metabolite transporter (DMT)-like permease